MRKMMVSLVSFVFLLMSCATIQIGQDSQEVLAKISARRIGNHLQVKYPDIAKECLPIAKAFVDKQESSGLFKDFVLAITNEIDDPLLKADIEDLLSIIEIQGPDIPDNYTAILDSAMNGFYKGLIMGGD